MHHNEATNKVASKKSHNNSAKKSFNRKKLSKFNN